MSKFIVVYFDDVPSDLERYKAALEEKLESTVVPRRPPPDLSLDGLPNRIDLVLIDWELTQKSGDGLPAPYRGGTLASRLTEVYPDVPLVVFSRPSIFRKLNVTPEKLVGADDWTFKENLIKDKSLPGRLISLMDGFTRLRRIEKRTWATLVHLLKADAVEADLLKESSPPLRTPVLEGGSGWTVHEAARWIRKVLIGYPGILYDNSFASTSLGISQESFLNEKVRETFIPAKYTGIFHEDTPVWWRGRLFKIAQGIISQAQLDGPIPNVFSDAFKKVFGIELKPSICVYSHKPHADTICYLLRQPVKREYTLEYLPDNRPSVMESARVSFKAIRESNQFVEDLLPRDSRSLVREIRK